MGALTWVHRASVQKRIPFATDELQFIIIAKILTQDETIFTVGCEDYWAEGAAAPAFFGPNRPQSISAIHTHL
jgi:hypothetical protein